MGKQLSEVERLEQATENLRQATREANGTAKDLRQLIKEAKELGPALVEKTLQDAVDAGFDEFKEEMAEARDKSVAKILKDFDRIEKILLASISKAIPVTSRVTSDLEAFAAIVGAIEGVS